MSQKSNKLQHMLFIKQLCQICEAWMLAFSFKFPFFYFYFSLFRSRVRVGVMSLSHGYILVISDNMVTVMVTSHKVTEKDIEGSERIISYNVCNICWP